MMRRRVMVVLSAGLAFACVGASADDEASGDAASGSEEGDADAEGTEGFEPGGCASTCGTPGCGTCPTPSMVDAGGVMIDAREVGVGAYAEFLALDFDPAVLPDGCAWKHGFLPEGWDPTLDPGVPVVGVDWCDAMAYCTWAGQTLCGALEGGPASWDEGKDFPNDAWLLACSNAGAQMYPYGNEYDPLACNGDDAGIDALVVSGSLPSCEGGVPGLFDMSGNVWEWTNACEAAGGDALTSCRRRGGSRHSDADALRCEGDSHRDRGTRDPAIGFRCCA